MSRKWCVVLPTSLGDLGRAWYLKIPARGKCEAFPVLVNCKGEGVDIGNGDTCMCHRLPLTFIFVVVLGSSDLLAVEGKFIVG